MASSLLILSNSDSGLYDFRKEVLKALLEKGFRVAVSVPDTGYVDKIKALGCEYIPTSFERRGDESCQGHEADAFLPEADERIPSAGGTDLYH